MMGYEKLYASSSIRNIVDAYTHALFYSYNVMKYSLWHNDTQLFKNVLRIYGLRRVKMTANITEGGNNCFRYVYRIYNQMIYK